MIRRLAALLLAPRPALYAALFAAAFLGVGGTLGGLGWLWGPPEGDLTRIGALSERRHGWSGAAQGWAQDGFVFLGADPADAPPLDVLILGDSFSIPRPHGAVWVNALHAETGLRIGVMRYRDADHALALLNGPAARTAAPAVVIFQTVERASARRFAAFADRSGCPPPTPARAIDLAAAPVAPARETFRRRAAFEGPDEMFSRGADALRRLARPNPTVRRLALTRDDLFTSAAPGALLVLAEDLAARRARPDPDAWRCGGAALAAEIRALGAEPLIMVAPDKTSVYAPFLRDPLPPRPPLTEALAEGAPGALVDLETPLRAAVAAGVRDVYWPNDTHWGGEGSKIVGEAAAAVLTTMK
jgi:hypothetical protein